MSNIIGKDNFKRMRHSLHLVITALTLFYIGGTSFRKITTMLEMLYNIKVSHVTISDWCKKFAPIFHSKMLTLMPAMNFDSDEWHADETVVKISGKKYYVWFIIDSETRFVLGFHLSPHRDSPQAFSLFDSVKQYSPVFGTVIELPNTKIRISDKVILTDSHITLCINLKEQNSDGEYINFGKTVVLLPYANGQKFIVIGVVI